MRRIAALAALALSTAVAPAAHATGAPAPAAPSATAKAADAGPTPAADDLTPAEAPEVEKESQDLAAERAAEQKAGLLPSPAEVAGSALDDMRGLGAVSPLRLNVGGALDPLLGDDLFCRNCPGPAALVGAPGVTGLDAIDLRVARHLFDIPMVVNDEVRELVDYFAVGPGHPHFQKWLDRAGRYIPLLGTLLKDDGLPHDLVFVSMVESGFAPFAYSAARAVGPWQFIRSTAHLYDLRMDPWVDERRDPVKATEAAARYLAWLHQQFGDWYLAFAGYNAGPGRVQRAMDSSGIHDYWTLCRRGLLPDETCRYVPKILAAALITRFPKAFGFDPPGAAPVKPFKYDTVKIKAPTALRDIARAAGVSFDAVKTLNPELRRWVTPPPARGEKAYSLRIPAGSKPTFEKHKSHLKPTRQRVYARHRVRAGDTLWGLARAYDCRPRDLMAINGIRNARALRLGMDLIVPLPYGRRGRRLADRAHLARRAPKPEAHSAGRAHGGVYTVTAGDTLWSIAQRFGVTTTALCRVNDLRDRDHVLLHIGQKLRLPGPAAATRAVAAKGQAPAGHGGKRIHVLAPGETLWSVAQRFGCTVKQLRQWNGITDPRSLKAGRKLVVAF